MEVSSVHDVLMEENVSSMYNLWSSVRETYNKTTILERALTSGSGAQ